MTMIHSRFPRPGVILPAALVALAMACAPKDAPKEPGAPTVTRGLPHSASARYLAIPPRTTALVLEGTFPADGREEFMIGEEAGSYMLVHVLTPGEAEPQVSVTRLDTGDRLSDRNATGSAWHGRLPATSGYLVTLEGGQAETPYALEIEVPRVIRLGESAALEVVNGLMVESAPLAYIVTAPPGRELSGQLLTAPPASYLTLHELESGDVLSSAEARSSTVSASATAGEYVLRLHPSGTGEFSLRLRFD